MTKPQTSFNKFLPSVEQRQKFYGFSILGCVIAIAFVLLTTLWIPDFMGSLFGKLLGTFAIMIVLASTLYLYSFSFPDKVSALLIWLTCGSVIGLSALGLLEIWIYSFDTATLIKWGLSFVVIGGVSSLIIAIRDDLFENKDLKKNNFLD